jgi:hypothetical protein
MEQLLKRIKIDVTKLKVAIKKEGDTLFQKFNSFSLKEGFQKTKKQLEEKALENYKKFEPIGQKILTDLSLRVKKISSDVSQIEEKVKKTGETATKILQQKKTGVENRFKAAKQETKSKEKKTAPKARKVATKKKKSLKKNKI